MLSNRKLCDPTEYSPIIDTFQSQTVTNTPILKSPPRGKISLQHSLDENEAIYLTSNSNIKIHSEQHEHEANNNQLLSSRLHAGIPDTEDNVIRHAHHSSTSDNSPHELLSALGQNYSSEGSVIANQRCLSEYGPTNRYDQYSNSILFGDPLSSKSINEVARNHGNINQAAYAANRQFITPMQIQQSSQQQPQDRNHSQYSQLPQRNQVMFEAITSHLNPSPRYSQQHSIPENIDKSYGRNLNHQNVLITSSNNKKRSASEYLNSNKNAHIISEDYNNQTFGSNYSTRPQHQASQKKVCGQPRKSNAISEVPSAVKMGVKREPLTEDEKKANHVFSEQRRRSLIRRGFSLLCEINPTLSGSSSVTSNANASQFSKSAILEKTAEYIVQLQDQVRQLQCLLQHHGINARLGVEMPPVQDLERRTLNCIDQAEDENQS